MSERAYHHVRWRVLIIAKRDGVQGVQGVPGTSSGKSRGTRSTLPCVWPKVTRVYRARWALKGSLRVSI